MRICVDTMILLDILKDEYPDFQERFYTALREGNTLTIPVIVYAELLPQFQGNAALLQAFLKDHRIQVEPLDARAAEAAARRWMQYLRRKTRIRCPACGHTLNRREHVLSDFYIGGYTLTHCDALLTRDRGIYRKYFPEIRGYLGCLD